MAEINIKTTTEVVPKIYAYTTPEIPKHDGMIKIGYTEQDDVKKRIAQQTKTADITFKLEWHGNAIFEGTSKTFMDTDFHQYLRKNDIKQKEGTEWFYTTPKVSKDKFYEFRENQGILNDNKVSTYKLRDEQEKAVNQTEDYMKDHKDGEFLWNAKPRFGKTLSTYDFIMKIHAQRVLIVTNRPAIANSWYADYEKFVGHANGYFFVTQNSALTSLKPEERKYIVSPESIQLNDESNYIEFESLQDLKGSIYLGGKYDKFKKLVETEWDVLVIDEAHEGVDTYKTDTAFNHIKRKFTLHLSGTPFKALANDKFESDAIFNWTYADEQKAKENWDKLHDDTNPYESLPRLNMFTYQMSEVIKDELRQGIDINGETEEFAFDLNEFFATYKDSTTFIHDEEVDKFLDALTTKEKYPFSTPELRDELKHTFWLLNRVNSAKALARKLKDHPVFKDYEIVLAAGDGKLDDDQIENEKAIGAVRRAIRNNDKTITLSVSQLTTGVTIPEWTAVIMLCNLKSPSLYMQAAFRAQNPCLFYKDNQYYRKENAYVFDFDPVRTLEVYDDFANDLKLSTSDGRGSKNEHEDNIRELLNFFPVIGEDEDGKMIELDASKVLSIPRKIKSTEVVRRGFMSDFLFANISRIFNAPKEVLDTIKSFEPFKEEKNKKDFDENTADNLHLNEDGEIDFSDEEILNEANDLFGPKIYDVSSQLNDVVDTLSYSDEVNDNGLERLKDEFKVNITQGLVDSAMDKVGDQLKVSEKNRIERNIENNVDRKLDGLYNDARIQLNINKMNKERELEDASEEEHNSIIQKYEEKNNEVIETFKETLKESTQDLVEDAGKEIVRTVNTSRLEKEKKAVEDAVKDHLRGFSRTIPSFLMAYGDVNTKLENFDQIIPDDVFKDVTSITLDQFRFLRDGGTYTDEETGESKVYEGGLFDRTVFNDSVQEFLLLKAKLANYFDENNKEDIFDYIPPQKTNQIFTPKKVVKQMVDYLEEENPGCFNDSSKTFIDLYMKSGLYLTEIVKRLFNSKQLKKEFPDDTNRLNHIFSKQIYGLAPTEIIYRIARAYVLGFDKDIHIEKDNLRLLDATPYAKEGTLDIELEKIYPELKD